MSDNLNDDDDLGLEDDSFDDFGKDGQTLGDLWRENPLIKIGVVVAAAVAIFGTIFLFGGETDQKAVSLVAAGSEVSAPPGTEAASPAYIEAVREQNQADVERAYREGESALPTPIDPPVGLLAAPEETQEEDDPLARWRSLQEERSRRNLDGNAGGAGQGQGNNANSPFGNNGVNGLNGGLGDGSSLGGPSAEAVQAMADLMSEQMQAVLENRTTPTVSYRSVTSESWLEEQKEKQQTALAEATAAQAATQAPQEIIFPAGQIAYAQLLTEANTDSPGPVLAQIVSGPLKGSRILGDFEEQNELLTLNFNTIVIDGVSHNIDAVALDPNTTLPGMATEVNHRYFKRVILPAAAAFIEGMADAIAESGRTNVTVQGETVSESTNEADNDQEVATGVREAGQELGEILDDIANETKVMVKIASGTPLGILFTEPVTK